ncbi:unnamed protein product [Adineta ricciae]|uniref:G-protein coupled receptors family 1 profile domain-containing protein n=1 Tax=Adineta ricciae TaxID=249248 RepID=A0A813SG20_ADIRI|nr:unnamed protein product [Adineta ricciae]CAF1032390.1 unnamed protein product [Adineta ricciae]
MSNLSTLAPSLADYAPYYYQFRAIHRFLVSITYPYIFFITFVGFITNTLTVILLSKKNVTKNLKNKWTLIALALSDLLFNTVLLIRGIHDLTKLKAHYICLVVSFLSHLAEILSACYTVAFTIQRYYAIRCPLEAAVRRRSSPIVSLLMIFILSSCFCFLISYYNNYEDCLEELYLKWFIADALFSFVIPVLLILIFNTLIVNYIRKRSYVSMTREASLFSARQLAHADDMDRLEHNPVTILSTTLSQDDGNEYIELNESNGVNQSFVTSRSERASSGEVSLNRQSRTKVQSQRFFYRQKLISFDSYFKRKSKKSSSQSNENETMDQLSTKTSQSIHVTRMLVLVSTCFLLLNAPGHICVIILKVYIDVYNRPMDGEHISSYDYSLVQNFTSNSSMISSSQSKESTTSDQLIIHLLYTAVLFAQLIAYASYSINFFLYSFSGINFRASLRQLIRRFRKH